MKQMKQLVAAVAVGLMCLSNYAKASVTMNFDGGFFTSSGSNISSGVLFVISSGVNATFDSGTWSNGATSLLNSDDKLVGYIDIASGVAQGALQYEFATAGVAAGQKLTGLFVAGNVASVVNRATGSLIGSNTFLSTGGTSFNFGSYRTDTVETYFGNVGDGVAWVVPSDGATLGLNVGSGTGAYEGDIAANLGTTGTFSIGTVSTPPIPEPSSASLLALGMAGFVALRARRKS